MDKSDLYSKIYLEKHLKELSLEAELSKIRREYSIRCIDNNPHESILEIGCGIDPLCLHYNNYLDYTIVEPNKVFFNRISSICSLNPRVSIKNCTLEESVSSFKSKHFDIIIMSSLLHEVQDPSKLLISLHEVADELTLIHLDVPNMFSFHRLLAMEMDLIPSIYEKSDIDKRFNRKNGYTKELLMNILEEHGFRISQYGTYFIKPFSNDQIENIIKKGVISPMIISGLEKMVKYLPEMGAEMFVDMSIRGGV
jgi:hypothetical protein